MPKLGNLIADLVTTVDQHQGSVAAPAGDKPMGRVFKTIQAAHDPQSAIAKTTVPAADKTRRFPGSPVAAAEGIAVEQDWFQRIV